MRVSFTKIKTSGPARTTIRRMTPFGSNQVHELRCRPGGRSPISFTDAAIAGCCLCSNIPRPPHEAQHQMVTAPPLNSPGGTNHVRCGSPHVPRHDVNRNDKLASGQRKRQLNIALDSFIGAKESRRPLKTGDFRAATPHRQEKSAPLQDALETDKKAGRRARISPATLPATTAATSYGRPCSCA